MRGAGFVLSLALAGAAFAHGGIEHEGEGEALRHLTELPDGPPEPFPVKLGGAFSLTNQFGERRTEADPEGNLQLVFFGYAQCQAICSVALPRMAEMAVILGEAGIRTSPILITVDPERDTPEAMRAPLANLSPDMIGLTGTEEELAAVRKLFQVEAKVVFDDPELGPVFAHGSFIYLLNGEGKLLTLIPPIMSPDQGAEIVARYAT